MPVSNSGQGQEANGAESLAVPEALRFSLVGGWVQQNLLNNIQPHQKGTQCQANTSSGKVGLELAIQ